tara:strand:- start:21832 stop:23490 length:1659 start_codon:yes stop_codon:yes gene_type:complete
MRYIIPDGLTQKFLLLGYKLIGIIFILLSIMFIIFWFYNRNFIFKKKVCLPKLKDFLLLALPMSIVIDYAIVNIEYLDLGGLIYLIGVTLIFVLFFSFILPVIFSYFVSYNFVMFLGLALSYTILNMAKISDNYNPGDNIFSSQLMKEALFLLILFSVIYFLYLFNKNIAYTAVIFFMLSGVVVNFYSHYLENTQIKEKKSDRLVEFLKNKNNEITKKKNIYILVYESYANLETLQHYGFDNTDQINFLKGNGFEIYNGIYSNSALSIGTTSRILEIESQISRDGRYYTSGNAFGLEIFKANNYKIASIFKSPYFFGSSKINWDDYHPKEDITKLGGKALTKAIFEGEFRFDIFDDDYDYNNYLELKKEFLSSSKKNTLFWTHNNFPGHSQNSGACKNDEKQSYFKRMEIANEEMKNDVLNIFENDENPIIVLLSDHGPYLTKNCTILKDYKIEEINKYDIQDRYGAFLSIYWPKDINRVENNLVITQDIFPTILSNITSNKNLFNELKVERRFFDRFNSIVAGVNVFDGIIQGGKDDGQPLFNLRSYNLPK